MNNFEEKKKTLTNERNEILSRMVLLNQKEIIRLEEINFELKEISKLEKESAE